MQYKVRRNNETLDEIVYKHYGSSVGYLEKVLLANTFLYEQDIYLKVGTVIELPETQVQTMQRIKLL